jgi:hypothetical protein
MDPTTFETWLSGLASLTDLTAIGVAGICAIGRGGEPGGRGAGCVGAGLGACEAAGDKGPIREAVGTPA